MLAVIRLAPEDRRQRAKRARTGKGLGCRDEQNRGGIKLRQPDQRSVVCLQLRVERESAVPSDRLVFRLVCLPYGERPRGNLVDSRNCAGGTPTPIPLDGIRAHEHRRTQTANRVPTASCGLRKAIVVDSYCHPQVKRWRANTAQCRRPVNTTGHHVMPCCVHPCRSFRDLQSGPDRKSERRSRAIRPAKLVVRQGQ